MAVDYISTAPWNDPLNPWPKYSQIALSAADTDANGLVAPAGVIYDLQYFNPVTPTAYPNGGANVCYYRNLAYSMVLFKSVAGPYWYLYDENAEDYYYACNIPTREVPFKNVGAPPRGTATNWYTMGLGAQLNSLYVAPVTTSLNPWERRRRRLLEIA